MNKETLREQLEKLPLKDALGLARKETSFFDVKKFTDFSSLHEAATFLATLTPIEAAAILYETSPLTLGLFLYYIENRRPETSRLVDEQANLALNDIASICRHCKLITNPEPEALSWPIEQIILLDGYSTTRLHKAAKANNISTVKQLAEKTEPELLRWKHLGRTTLNETKQWLSDHGLWIGMTFGQSSDHLSF